MLESEVKSLVPPVLGSRKVNHPLIFRHSIQLACLVLVAENILDLRQKVENNVHADNDKELLVATTVQGSIIYAIVSMLVMPTGQLQWKTHPRGRCLIG